MSDNFKPSGKKRSISPKAGHQRPKSAYGTKKQAYVVSENGKKSAYTVRISDSHKGPLMHIGVNPPTSDPPPPLPGKKPPTVPKGVIVHKTVTGKNTTKVIKKSIYSKAARKLEQSCHINNKHGGARRKK